MNSTTRIPERCPGSIKQKFFYFIIWLFVIELNLYMVWSKFIRLFQKLLTKKNINISNLFELENILYSSKYKKDPWYLFGGCLQLPERIMHRYFLGEPIGDCESYSVLAAKILNNFFPKNNIKIIIAYWMNEKNEFKAHALCAFRNYYKNKTNWICNWYLGKTQYTDFEFETQGFVKLVHDITNGKCFCFLVIDPFSLKIENYVKRNK